MHHYSGNIRKEAIFGLKELLSANVEILTQHLAAILDAILPRIIDEDATVRNALHSLLNVIWNLVNSGKLSPHFPLILAQLKCGLTHSNENIKDFALKLCESVAESHPDFVRSNPEFVQMLIDLLPNFGIGNSSKTSTNSSQGKIFSLKRRTSAVRTLRNLISTLENNDRQPLNSEFRRNPIEVNEEKISVDGIFDWKFRKFANFSVFEKNRGIDWKSRIDREKVVNFLFGIWTELMFDENNQVLKAVDEEKLKILRDIFSVLKNLNQFLTQKQKKNLIDGFPIFQQRGPTKGRNWLVNTLFGLG